MNRFSYKLFSETFKDPAVNLNAYPPDGRLCVYTVLKECLSRTKQFIGNHGKLLLTYFKPHNPVSGGII